MCRSAKAFNTLYRWVAGPLGRSGYYIKETICLERLYLKDPKWSKIMYYIYYYKS